MDTYFKKKILLNSATGVLQFVNTSMVTIIGETHDDNFTCKTENSISIFEYCKLKIKENKNCKILLEFPPQSNKQDRIGSKIIRDVFTTNDKTVRNNTEGVDIRSMFIGMINQNNLYHDSSKILSFNTKTIKKYYVDTFSEKKLIEISGYPNDEQMSIYLKNIIEKFKKIQTIEHVFNDDDLLELKWAWAMVMDYEILNKISKNKNIEFIIVVGNNHLINIKNILTKNNYVKIITDIENANSNNCINLKKLKH